MSNDKMREEFEAWWLSGTYPFRVMDRLEDAGVSEESAQEIWQASRESLVLELPASPYMPDSEPESMTGYEVGEAQGRCDMWANVREAIEAAGVKVKS
ncbi:hypothetical protein BTW15_01360 [Pseudomonas syringae pv. tomato]|uniref:Uncharacterized protein n=1 Tax=Pseudomonas syringae pv. tomato TaxID=323 RepID=A0AB36KZY8_PSEUB|nr:hypothetical protein [Pseudomonas syringae group genomosp. 3]MBX6510492.1 hypothetical protein [Pseudomonas syringae pv. tomato]OPE62024.1 hypothetical protein BTW15_01360 [Pseudomonas syringae pv. tomato]TES59166.1 hypothetical protein E2N91_11255 [Pseudomonas syringae pv. tomato]TES74672.1 hypothetical protein E2N89_23695 [Pseudomonas syringae pv. tomato]